MLGDAGSIPSTSSKSAVGATATNAAPAPDSSSPKNKPRAGAKAGSRGARAKEIQAPVQAKRTSTPPPKKSASPLASNPKKDLSGEFAKAAGDPSPALLDTLEETQLEETLGNQQPEKPAKCHDFSQMPSATHASPAPNNAPENDERPDSNPRAKTQDLSAKPKESQGNGSQEATKLSPVASTPGVPKHDEAPHTKPENVDEAKSAEPKESRGNGQEATKLSPVPPGPKQNNAPAKHPDAVTGEARQPRHVDTQDTINLFRGDSVVSDFQDALASGKLTDPVLDMAHTLQAQGALEMHIPEQGTCLDMQKSPGKLWVYRNGDEAADSGRAFEVLKWTRMVAAKCNGAFEAQDSAHGALARALHDSCLCMLSLQSEYEEAKAQFSRYSGIILSVGATKKQKEKDKNHTPEVLTSKFEQIDNWVTQKLDEKDLCRQEVCKKLDEHIATFSEVLVKLLENTESEYKSTTTSSLPEDDEAALCMELDNQLNMHMHEVAAPAASEVASTRALASPVPGSERRPAPATTSWQQQGMRAAMQRMDTSELAAMPLKIQPEIKEGPKIEPVMQEAAPTQVALVPPAPPLQKMKAEPEFASEEDRQEWEEKQAKRLKHNARVRFDSPDCPQIVLDKLQEWLAAGEDWANTQLVIEATRVNEEKFKAKEKMRSYKSLCDEYGKKTADSIRTKKYAKEKAWELFRVFDTIEFEFNENNTTSAAFHSEGSISSQAAGPILMPNNAGATAGGGADLLKSFGKSQSAESLTNPPGTTNQNPRKTGKVNEYSFAKKVNAKIQAMAGKLTDIIVWSTKLSESSQKAKDNYQEELDSHKNVFGRIKGELEGLYSIHNNTKDVDMPETTKGEIQGLLDRADAATTTFTGAMKPLKLTLEPFRHIELCKFMSMYVHVYSNCTCLALRSQSDTCTCGLCVCVCACVCVFVP
ncbi:unnamed protein product [Symbiodinium sp. CCMP2592]|nr:unnamed protein product [Symbiodinium sp. CCMP2592]